MVIFFQLQVASNFVFANANPNRGKSDEYALVGVICRSCR